MPTESSVNMNRNTCTESQLGEVAQPQQINLQFGAINPVQFESSKAFDQMVDHHDPLNNQSAEFVPMNNNVNVNATEPAQPNDTSHYFPNFNSTNASNAFSEIPPPQEPNRLFDGLEGQNQELTNLLQMEKMRNHELSVKVTQQHSTIEQLNVQLMQLHKNSATVQELHQQIDAHVQTVNILVGEKSDLSGKLQQKDQRIAEYESECGELQGRLKASRHRVAELEKDLNTLTQSHQKYDGSQQALCSELETLQEDNKRLKRLHQESCDENAEMQHQLATKTKEIDEMRNAIGTKCNELEMAYVRLEQLTGGDLNQTAEVNHNEQSQQQQSLMDTERQIIELQNMISELTNDRDRTQQQYQTYVQHLTNETTTMSQRIQELCKVNEKLTKREASLVNHVQELEKQIQKQISTQRRLATLRDEAKLDEANTNGDGSLAKEELITIRAQLSAAEKEKSDLHVSSRFIYLCS